jgi:2,4-dichlorophenol 6-monooxygenase
MAAFSDGIDETEVPTSAMVETDVVIIGSGPAGASMALAL